MRCCISGKIGLIDLMCPGLPYATNSAIETVRFIYFAGGRLGFWFTCKRSRDVLFAFLDGISFK